MFDLLTRSHLKFEMVEVIVVVMVGVIDAASPDINLL